MPIFGRRDVPGDMSLKEQLDSETVRDRTIRAQVTSVDPDNGFVLVDYSGLPSGGRYVTVPPLWMSFPPPNAAVGPAWGRYMPQPTDIMKLSFDRDGSIRAVGYDIVANSRDVADGYSGWPELMRLYEAALKPGTDPAFQRFGQFVPLKPGEYDFMSSGGAYVYGNNRGRLYLAGGSVTVSLTKTDFRLDTTAQMWKHQADECDLRFGQARRVKDQATGLEVATADAAAREFNLRVNRGQSKLGQMVVGNVIGEDGSVINSRFNNPVRYRLELFTASSASALLQQIDNVGNIEYAAPNAQGGIFLDFSAGKWESKNTEVLFNASSKFSVVSPSVNLGDTSPTEQLVLGTTYINAQTTWATDINTFASSLNTAVVAFTTALTTWAGLVTAACVPLAIPIVGGAAAAALISAANASTFIPGVAAFTASVSAASGLLAGKQAAFTTLATNRYLSNVSRTK